MLSAKTNLISTGGYPSTAYYHCFNGTVPPLSPQQRKVILKNEFSLSTRHRSATTSMFVAYHVPIILSWNTFRCFL